MTVTPVNYRKQDASPEAIERDVDYALQIADFYLEKLPEGRRHLANLSVLELGPGYSLGTAVVLASHGARVSVADRYLSAFDPEYHDPFLRALLSRLQHQRPELYTAPIVRLLEAQSFLPDVVDGLHLGIEDLHEVPDGAFDLVLSNAVFEHVEDVPAAWRILARITRSGGMGIHQVDFRDHRDFSRPLEALTMGADEFTDLFREVHGECGNRWRPGAMQAVIEQAGFDVSSFQANMFAEESYLDDLLPRLHADYCELDRSGLCEISGCFVLKREPDQAALAARAADSPASLAQAASLYSFVLPWVAGKRVLDLGCGSAWGVQQLLRAGADDVVGVDRDGPALEAARVSDPRGDAAWDAYLAHDLEQPLPLESGSFDVITAFDLLGQVRGRQALCAEILRLLSPSGVAMLSLPNKAFLEQWADPSDPRLATTPDLDQLVELLAPFGWVDFHAQVDLVASLVLPLDGREDELAPAGLCAPAGTSPADRSASTIIARCFRTRPVQLSEVRPLAHAYPPSFDAHTPLPAADRAVLQRLSESAAAHIAGWRDNPAGPAGSGS